MLLKLGILTDRDMNYLMIFERRILSKISGPVKGRDGWRIMTNHELNKLIGGANIMRFIKAHRLKWCSYLRRMEE
jgi:hypothetical protein